MRTIVAVGVIGATAFLTCRFVARPSTGDWFWLVAAFPANLIAVTVALWPRREQPSWRTHARWLLLPAAMFVPWGAGDLGAWLERRDFARNRRPRYEALIRRAQLGEFPIAVGELVSFVPPDGEPLRAGADRIVPLDESWRGTGHRIHVRHEDDGTWTVIVFWADYGPPPAGIAYYWRSDGEWSDRLRNDWHEALGDGWFRCGFA